LSCLNLQVRKGSSVIHLFFLLKFVSSVEGLPCQHQHTDVEIVKYKGNYPRTLKGFAPFPT